MSFESQVISIEREGHVATLWLDNEAKRNAMGPDFWADLPLAVEALTGDVDVRAIVIAANGPHFTVGLDLKSMGGSMRRAEGESAATQRLRSYREVKRLQASISSVADCPVPVIAAVHGYCIGGGIDLICAADIRLASADAKFSVRETKVAITADVGTLQRLPKVLTAGHVAELVYTGKDIDAARAREIGLVNDVLADRDAVIDAARVMAGEIAANSPLAVQGSKAVLRAGEALTVEQGLDQVALWNSAFLPSDDLTEAMMAFVEKRKPEFRGA
jgi:enoyl-CoA hydratase